MTRILETVTLSKIDSGLPFDLWIDSAGVDRDLSHNLPRVEVKASSGRWIPVSISKSPEILINTKTKKDYNEVLEVIPFISKSYSTLIKHWNKELTDYQALKSLIELAHQ